MYLNHLDWFLRSYLDLLYGIHGDSMFTEADHAAEIIERIKDLGPDYATAFLPPEFWGGV